MQPKEEQEDPSIIRGTNKKCMFVRCAAIKGKLNFYAFMLESFYASVQIFSSYSTPFSASPSLPNSSIHQSHSLSGIQTTIEMLRRWWVGIRSGFIQFNCELGDKLAARAMKSSCTSSTGSQEKLNRVSTDSKHRSSYPRLHATF